VTYPRFLDSEAELLASSDAHVPINGAVLLIKPSEKLFALGRHVLQTLQWDPAHGFNHSGAPRMSLAPAASNSQVDMPRMFAHRDGLNFRITRTGLWKRDHWNTVDGDSDQGLLAHVFLVMLQGRTFRFASPLDRLNTSNSKPTMTVHHFYSGHKPWKRTARCAAYFNFLAQPDFVMPPTPSPCVQRLLQKRACVVGPLDAAGCRACEHERQKTAWTCGPPGFKFGKGCSACTRKALGAECTCEMRPRCPDDVWWRVL